MEAGLNLVEFIKNMSYRDLIHLLNHNHQVDPNGYLFSNHNGELVNQAQINFLDAKIFPLDLIHEINRSLLKIPIDKITYDSIDLNSMVFIGRLEALIRYYEKAERLEDAFLIERLAQKVFEINKKEVTITKDPNLLISGRRLHPDILKNPLLRRILYGFVMLRKLPRKDVLNVLEEIPQLQA